MPMSPCQKLAALGHPGYSDEFAAEVWDFMHENNCGIRPAIDAVLTRQIQQAKERAQPC